MASKSERESAPGESRCALEVVFGELQIGLATFQVAFGLADFLLAGAILRPGEVRLGGGQACLLLECLGFELRHFIAHEQLARFDRFALGDEHFGDPAADLGAEPNFLDLDDAGQVDVGCLLIIEEARDGPDDRDEDDADQIPLEKNVRRWFSIID